MKHVTFNSFGYIVTKAEYDAHEVIEDYPCRNEYTLTVKNHFNPDVTKETYSNNNYDVILLYTKGKVNCNILTKGRFEERGPGFCTLDDPYVPGIYLETMEEPVEVFSILPENNFHNSPVLPRVSTFRLMKDDTRDIPAGTKIFLASGKFTAGTSTVEGPTSVSFSTQRSILAQENSYGFIFE